MRMIRITSIVLTFILSFLLFNVTVIQASTVNPNVDSSNTISIMNLTEGSTTQYTDCKIAYLYNGSELNLNGSFGIIAEDGSALGPMVEIFQKGLNVSCDFDLCTQAITLSSASSYITLVIGSTKAIVNGEPITMDTAPQILKLADNSEKIYVPTRFIAETLGYEYTWNSVSSEVEIIKNYSISYRSEFTEQPIVIPLYDDITLEDIRLEDMYYDNQLAIYLPGDYTSDYENNTIVNHYSSVTGIELGVNADNETVFTLTTSKIKGCQLSVSNNNLYITLAAPDELYNKIVVIDPGHGGKDSGAVRNDLYEKDFNLSIAYENTKDLFAASDIKVYYTRETDIYSTIDTRAAFAAKVNADFYVAVHQNTNNNTANNGTSVYYSSLNNPVQANGLSSKVMATLFKDNLVAGLGTKNFGVINESFTVTTFNSVPSCLIELVFMSNDAELAKLQDPEFRKKSGQIIFNTVKRLFELYPTKR